MTPQGKSSKRSWVFGATNSIMCDIIKETELSHVISSWCIFLLVISYYSTLLTLAAIVLVKHAHTHPSHAITLYLQHLCSLSVSYSSRKAFNKSITHTLIKFTVLYWNTNCGLISNWNSAVFTITQKQSHDNQTVAYAHEEPPHGFCGLY